MINVIIMFYDCYHERLTAQNQIKEQYDQVFQQEVIREANRLIAQREANEGGNSSGSQMLVD